MKTLISISNQYGFQKKVNLSELKEMICERRKIKLSFTKGNFKNPNGSVKHMIKVETNQPATSFSSHEIMAFNLQKAVEIFNAGGIQVAVLTK